jgi:hypothetical protein
MTTRHIASWLASFAGVVAIGCGGSTPPADAPPTPTPVLAPPVTDDLRSPVNVAQTPADQTKPIEPVTVVPNDAGGKAVAKALVAPPKLADESVSSKPAPYSSAIDRAESPLPSVALRPFSPTEPKASAAKPSPPKERHQPPADVTTLPEGRGADKPRAKATSPSNPGASDVPPNAWRQGDRPPLGDPTADLSAGQVIGTPLPATMGQLPYLRVSIPDPFELVEHLKGKLGKDTELGAGPMK